MARRLANCFAFWGGERLMMRWETYSALDERLWRSLAVAVNREYGSASIELRDGDEVCAASLLVSGDARIARVEET